MSLPVQLLPLLIELERQKPIPDDEDVVAGSTGFYVFMTLIAVVALLAWSLTRQLKKVRAARDAGVYGDEPVQRGADGAAEVREDDRTQG